jgi:hypothetical protein
VTFPNPGAGEGSLSNPEVDPVSIPERRLGDAAGGPLDERVVLDFMDEVFT